MTGLETTLKVLARTPNEAATSLLAAALDVPDLQVQEAALRTLLDRRSVEGHCALVRRWTTLGERWRALLCERAERLFPALRATIGDSRPEVSTSGAAAAVAMHEYNAMPVLLAAAESRQDGAGEAAAGSLLALADSLYEELASPRNYRDRRDPQLVHQHVTSALEGSITRWAQHTRSEILEAFVLLAKSENGVLRGILDDPRHPGHQTLRDILRTSPRLGVINKILKMLERGMAPTAVVDTVGQRSDVPFLRRLTKLMDSDASEMVRRNLRRVPAFHWFDDLHVLQTLSDIEQQAIVEIAMSVSAQRDELFRVIDYLLREGNVGGRRAAAAALQDFRSPQADRLVLAALDDPDPIVQSHATRQLRSRNIQGAMRRLIPLIDHPHEQVRAAARESLSEFNFQRYLSAFEILDPEVRKTTGMLVRKIDLETTTQLTAELASPSRIRRMRALQVAPLMHAVDEVESQVIELLNDEDHFIRAEAVKTLGAARSPAAQRALREALHDRNHLVQQAAQEALAAMLRPLPVPPPIDSSFVMLPSDLAPAGVTPPAATVETGP